MNRNKKLSRFILTGALCCSLIGNTTYAADVSFAPSPAEQPSGSYAPQDGPGFGDQTSYTHGSETTVSKSELKTEIPSNYTVNDTTQGSAKKADYAKLFADDDVEEVNLTIDNKNWNYLLQNAIDKPYVMVDSVSINGESVAYVGLKTKGNITLKNTWQSNSDRFSFTVNVGKYIKKKNGYFSNQNFYGLNKFCLNSISGDSTYLKEYLSYKLMASMGVPAPYCCMVKLSVNGQYWGVYCMVESIDKSLSSRTTGNSDADMYKCESPGGDLIYSDTLDSYLDGTNAFDLSTYSQSSNPLSKYTGLWNRKETGTTIDDYLEAVASAVTEQENASANEIGNKVKTDMTQALTWMKKLNELSNSSSPNTDDYKKQLESILNVDEVLRYFAANTYVANLDSYQSEKQQNYCLSISDGKALIIPWDYNYSYGAYGFSSASDVINFSIDNPVLNTTLKERPLLNVLLQNNDYRKQYESYLADCCKIASTGGTISGTDCRGKTFTNTYPKNNFSTIIDNFLNGALGTTLRETSIEPPFYTYEQYATASSALKTLITQRSKAVMQQIAGNTERISDEGISLSELGMGGGMGAGSTPASGTPGMIPDGSIPSGMPMPTESTAPNISEDTESNDSYIKTLDAPEVLTYQNVNLTSLKLAWTSVKNADGYYIYQYNTTKKKYILIKKTTADTFRVTNLTAGSIYRFKICAYEISSNGVEKGTDTKVLKAGTKLPTTTIRVLFKKKTSVKLRYNKVKNADGYEIYRAASKNGTYNKITTIKNPSIISYSDKDLTSGKTYYYKIRSYRTVGGVKTYSSFSRTAVKK